MKWSIPERIVEQGREYMQEVGSYLSFKIQKKGSGCLRF